MSITYTWSIANMERNVSNDVIVTCHWYCLGTDADGNSSRSYGTTSHTPDPSDDDYIAYNDLTEATVLEWVHEQVDKDATEAAIASKIDAIVNPTTATGMPWAVEETE